MSPNQDLQSQHQQQDTYVIEEQFNLSQKIKDFQSKRSFDKKLKIVVCSMSYILKYGRSIISFKSGVLKRGECYDRRHLFIFIDFYKYVLTSI